MMTPHTPIQTRSETDRLTHELQVHQAELESQNEELRHTQLALAAARDRYQDLYEFAPVGYLTLDRQGCIREANLMAAMMLGKERQRLKRTHLASYLQATDADQWHVFLTQMAQKTDLQRIQLAFTTGAVARIWYGQMDCLRVIASDGDLSLRVTLSDVSEHMQADLERRIAALDADAREAERRRVALELHENLGQRLAALKIEIGNLSRIDNPIDCQACMESLLQTLDDAVHTVRRITTDLHPPMLDDLGLNAAIEWLAQDTARRLGLRFRLSLDQDIPPLSPTLALALYRFTQESLAHLLRDMAGIEFRIDLLHTPQSTILALKCRSQGEPSTPGTPLDTQAEEILQHRARMMGGELATDAQRDGRGWQGLQLTLPRPLDGATPSASDTEIAR